MNLQKTHRLQARPVWFWVRVNAKYNFLYYHCDAHGMQVEQGTQNQNVLFDSDTLFLSNSYHKDFKNYKRLSGQGDFH